MRIPEQDLPLFPLKTVLFPRMLLPLRIFEPRYQELLQRCIDQDIGFGVVLIKEGEEVGEAAAPYSVGTIARILEAKRLPDGQAELVTMGVVRFRILQTHEEHSYLSGDIERWEDEMGETRALERGTKVALQVYKEYVADLIELTGAQAPKGQLAPEDPQVLSYTIAVNLQIPDEEKQALLEMESVEKRLRHEITLLERERGFLKRVRSTRDLMPKNDEEKFSKN